MPWSVQDYGCWYVSKELLIFIFFISANLLFAQDDTVSDYYGYTTGSQVKLECPIGGEWFNVGTQCFKIGTNNGTIQIVNFDDANALCFSPENNFSQPLNLPNWYKSVDLSKYIYPKLNSDLSAAFQNTSSEIWTGLYFDVGDISPDCSQNIPYFDYCTSYPPLKVVTTGKTLSLFTPLWAKSEPKIPSFIESAISFNINFNNGNIYGWKVQKQSLYLPAVCQTFACFKETFRCHDNSQCIPNKAICDHVTDCADASDEADCGKFVPDNTQIFTKEFGVIRASATSCIFKQNIFQEKSFCEWHISQTPGTIIRVNFLDLRMIPADELLVEGFKTGEILKLSNNGPFTHLFADNELRVRYKPSPQNIVNEKANGSIRGFQLHYSAEETTSCITKFDVWDGQISTPAQIYDGNKYRPLLDCRWSVAKRGSTLLGIQIPLFDLAFGDWLKIYESETENENGKLLGMFGNANSPPTAFATHFPFLIFEFHSEKQSPGAAGISINFQQTCLNVYLSESYGQIESPGFRNEEYRNPFHCSWIIEVPCETNECKITFYFDVLNLTNKDSITIETDYEKIIIDSNSLPILSHQTKLRRALLQMHSTQKYFAAQISYSIDCPKPDYGSQVIAQFETIPHVYRSSVDYSCISSPHIVVKKGSCEKGGKWNILPPSCEITECSIYPNITNGYIVNINESDGQFLNYQCQIGYLPNEPTTVECISGKWNSTFLCTLINCPSPDTTYFNFSHPTGVEVEATLAEAITNPTYLSFATYKCDKGSLRGKSAVRICQENGHWSDEEMYCKLPICLITEITIVDGDLDIGNDTYVMGNTTVAVKCYNQFELNGEPFAYCNESGNWVEPFPACSPRSNCTSYDCGYGTPRFVDEINACKCECFPGYWQNNNETGECVDIDECAMGFALCTPDTTCKNENGNYSCDLNAASNNLGIYSYPEMRERNFPEQLFVFPNISVVRKRCPEPTLFNAILQPEASLRLVGENLEIYCTFSQTLLEYECLNDSNWDAPPQCPLNQAPTCSPPSSVDGLILTPDESSYALGDIVEFSCKNDSQLLIGPSYTVCALYPENNTAAFVAIPICQWEKCSEIVINSSSHLQNNFNEESFIQGNTIELKCEEGFEMVCPADNQNCSFITCQQNLYWSSELPFCNSKIGNCNIEETDEITSEKMTYNPGEKIAFHCMQPNYALSDSSDIYCGTTKSSVNEAAQFRNDMITKNFWNQKLRNTRQASTDFPKITNIPKIIETSEPYKESIFDTQNIGHGWDKSDEWNYSSNKGWSYSAQSPNNNNYLISPMIRVQLDTGTIDVAAENMNSECIVEISYFTANYLISSVPENKFKTIIWLNSTASHQKATIKIVYSILWIMMKAKNCKNVNIKNFDISRINCPMLHVGLTHYPTTPTAATDIVVGGMCAAQALSLGNFPQLICTKNGKWQLPSDAYNPSTCNCNTGYVQQGQTCVKEGPQCFHCELGSIDFCTNSTLKHCNVGEACLTRIQKNVDSIYIEKGCSASCITNFRDFEKCKNGSETCTLCCGSDYCNALPHGIHEVNKRNKLSAPIPSCIDMQPMEIRCQASISVKRIKSAFSEPVAIPWPQIIDNSPKFRVSSNLLLNSEEYIFNGDETEIKWIGIDKHEKSAQCITNVVYEDYEEPQIQCPEMHIDLRAGTTSKYVTIKLPTVETKDSSAVHLIYSPPNDTVIEIDYPLLVNVTAIDSAGNLAQCQFWYMAVASDCPLWKIDTNQFICTQSENITVCHRRKPCTTRELPLDFKAIVCIPGQRWRFVQDITPVNRLSETHEMVRTPYCLEQEASNITLSITFRIQTVQPTCADIFVTAIQEEMNNFVNRHCQNIGWNFLAKDVENSYITFNFSTTNPNTESVLLCISEITNSLTRELPQAKIECAPLIKSHTITYHVYCSHGWGANTNLRCEKCPPGYYSVNEVCVPCRLGTYSSGYGSRECLPCDSSTSTINEGAISSDECLPLCGLGYYSSNGLAPCQICPKGSFQNKLGGLACTHCSFNATTVKQGSHSIQDCLTQCSPGRYSIGSGGVEPCSSCPKSYYQKQFGSEVCEKCPSGTTTYLSGATSRDQCLELNCQYTECQNGGTCQEGQCRCEVGFAGYDCTVPLSLCSTAYCLNDAICQETQNQSLCICKEGFNGTRCELKLERLNAVHKESNLPEKSSISDKCFSWLNSCVNGKCNSSTGECDCNVGFHYNGSDCIQENACQFTRPCFNGSCVSQNLNNYFCNCDNSTNFSKSTCAYFGDCDVDSDCNNGSGSCLKYQKDGKLYGKCFCHGRYTGTHCDVLIDPCEAPPSTCMGCSVVDDSTDYYCDCELGYFGESCETKINPCYDQYRVYFCSNGGSCNGSCENASCSCAPGWTGQKCDTPIDYCSEKPCSNNASCTSYLGGYGCQCLPGHYGKNCQSPMDACQNHPENDGSCGHGNCSLLTDDNTGYNCECEINWSKGNETACIYPQEDCNDSNCMHGNCVNDFKNNKSVCFCDDGYYGDFCNLTYCSAENLCSPGKCQDVIGGGYYCICENNEPAPTCKNTSPCDSFNCGNGTCVENGTSPYCSCQLGFYGLQCENKTSYCDTPDGKKCSPGICTPTDNGGYCKCPVEKYGPHCDKEKDRNYDLYFTGRPSTEIVESPVILRSSLLEPFILCLWVRPGANSAIETNAQAQLRLQASDQPFLTVVANNAQRDVIISMTMKDITVKQKTENFNSSSGWNHLCLQRLSDVVMPWLVFVNGDPTPKDFPDFNSLDDDLLIVLAPPIDNSTFQGELSFVELYGSSVDSSMISYAISNCVEWSKEPCSPENETVCWSNFTTVSRFNTEIITIRPGICYTENCNVGTFLSADCLNPNAKTPPQVVNCPGDMLVPSNEQFIQVSFKYDVFEMFTDQSPITQVTSNFRNGQFFQWGQYRIIITAKDYQNNTATCQFTLTVYPNKTDEIKPDDNTLFSPMEMNSSDQIRYISSAKCKKDDYIIAKDYSPFYVCDIMGQWQRYAAAVQSDFNIPQCVQSVEGNQILYASISVVDNSFTCDGLKTKVEDIIAHSDACKNGCEINTTKCMQRFKRDAEGNTTVDFFVSTNTTRVAIKTSVIKALEASFPGSKTNVTNSQIECINNEEEFPVKVENENYAVCSVVPMGSYWNNKLEECPKNTFKDSTNPCSSAEACCEKCPDGKVTAMEGSLSPTDCYKNCPIGSFYNEGINDCQLCPKGNYQAFSGKRYCDQCLGSTTTLNLGSVNSNECVKCPAGKEIGQQGDCVDCPIGTFRNEDSDSCLPCGKGLTTTGAGSINDSHCNVVFCPPGSQLRNESIMISADRIFAKKGCQYCSRGTYQYDFNQESCMRCESGFTTIATNSTTVGNCVAINTIRCFTKSDCEQYGPEYDCTCDSVANQCIKKCQRNDGVPINEASQLWWISLLIAFFVLLLVIVIVFIVWRRHMINCCLSLIPSWLLNFFPEKLKSGMTMRVSTLRRSRPSSMVSIPEEAEMEDEYKENENHISLPRLTVQKSSVKSASNHSAHEEETSMDNHTLNDIRNGLRDAATEPESSPVLHKGEEKRLSIRQRIQSPKAVDFGLRVQTSHHSLQNQTDFEHVKKENGHSIKTSSYSKQGVQNSSYSLSMSQNVNSKSDKEVITAPPVLKWLQDKLAQDSQKPDDNSVSMQPDQRTTLDALSSPDWNSFNQLPSSRRSSSSNSDDPTTQFRGFESNNKNNVNQYFNKNSAFSRNSVTSAHRTGSFYARNSRVQPYNSPNLTSVDDDPDAFFS